MTAKQHISVVMPVFNCERYVSEAIESILSQRTQHSLELIVVDDGSTDQTARTIRHFGESLRYVFQNNAGIGTARNTGIELTNYEYLAFLDADDLWMPDKIEMQMSQLLDNSGIDAVYGQGVQFLSPELDPDKFSHLKIITEPSETLLSSVMLIRKQAFQRVGAFSSTSIGTDIDWGIRARELELLYYSIPRVIYKRRIHDNNNSQRERANKSEYARILKRSLDRRRKNSELHNGRESRKS